MRRNTSQVVPPGGGSRWEQFRASGFLRRAIGSDSLFDRRQRRDLPGERYSVAVMQLQRRRSKISVRSFAHRVCVIQFRLPVPARTAARNSFTISFDALIAAACWSTLKEI